MLRVTVFAAVVVGGLAAAPALAGPADDCEHLSGDPAIAACDLAIRQNPRDEVSYFNRGIEYRIRGDYARAIADLTKAIALKRRDAQNFTARGLAHAFSGDLERAVADFAEAIRIAPSGHDGYLNRGLAHLAMGRQDRADADYDKAISVLTARLGARPRDAQALSDRCWVRAVFGRELEAARADCDAALALRPRRAEARDSRGLVHLRLGRLEQALADYDAAIEIEPRNWHALYGRGLVKLRMGDRKGGDADISKALISDREVAREYAWYGIR